MPPTHPTLTILARDPQTREIAVAGNHIPHAHAGTGAVAIQPHAPITYTLEAFDSLENHYTAQQALNHIMEQTPDQNGTQQIAILDNNGNTAVHTGPNCPEYAGHHIEHNLAIIGTELQDRHTIPAVLRTYKLANGPFALRLITALKQGPHAHSAALKIVKAEASSKWWKDIRYDIHIDHHTNPLQELEHIYRTTTALHHIKNTDFATSLEETLHYFKSALEAYPDHPQALTGIAVTYHKMGEHTKEQEIKKKIDQDRLCETELSRPLCYSPHLPPQAPLTILPCCLSDPE